MGADGSATTLRRVRAKMTRRGRKGQTSSGKDDFGNDDFGNRRAEEGSVKDPNYKSKTARQHLFYA
jgi:hypothetical protein